MRNADSPPEVNYRLGVEGKDSLVVSAMKSGYQAAVCGPGDQRSFLAFSTAVALGRTEEGTDQRDDGAHGTGSTLNQLVLLPSAWWEKDLSISGVLV
jgi:hypothetical protein